MAGEKGTVGCELCGGVAAVHCAADSAFLCAACDAKVHGANFLASRHLRRRLAVDHADHADADAGLTDSGSESSSSSSSCVSTADSTSAAAARGAAGRRSKLRQRRRRRARAEVVLEGWAKRMGLAPGAARWRAARAAAALRALGRGVSAARVPLRVAMAAALWSEVCGCGCGGGEAGALLRRLEAGAHVPARLVLAVASWMAARTAGGRTTQEGWAECS